MKFLRGFLRFLKRTCLFIPIATISFSAVAQFEGSYAPENWTFTSQDLSGQTADGSIDLSNMPTGFTLTGNDDGLSGANSLYAITIPADGTIKFKWSYITNDGPEYDKAGYKLNGTFVELTNIDDGQNQSGEETLVLVAGDEFAFVVDATDACCGRGHMTIEAFGVGENTKPTLNVLADIFSGVNPGQIDVNLEGITAGVSESTQTISITATSSNTAVIPDPTISYTSPNATGTLSFTPVTDAYGDATITVNVMDDGGTPNESVDNIDVTFNVSIAENFAPEINLISDVQSQVNEVLNITLAGISAGSGETQTISVVATSSDQSVIADEDIDVTYTSPNATGSLLLTPQSNVSGTTTITVTVTDDGGTANNGQNETVISFDVVIDPNNSPQITAVDDLNLFVNPGEQVIDLSGIADGDANVDQSLTLTATSDNTSLIPDPVVTYTSPNTTGTLTFTPLTDQFGSARVTVTLGDNGGTSNGGVNEASFSFNVMVADNYAPTLDPVGNVNVGVNEPGHTIQLTGISAGVVSNSETISVSASSSNTSIVAAEGLEVIYTNPNATGSLVINPVTDAVGEAMITVTVSDDGGVTNGGVDQIEETFFVRVEANNMPAIDQVAAIGLDINAAEQTVDLSGITSGESSNYQTLAVTASSDNTSLIPDPVVIYASPGSTGTLTFIPEADATGTANITVTVTDDGGTADGGINKTTMTFEVAVTGNQPPTLDEISDQNRIALDIFTVHLTGISDGTALDQNLVITATSDNPTIIPNPTVNYVNGGPNGSLSFEPVDFGDATITVTITDDGGTENGGVDTFIRTFAIHIGENTAPEIMDWNGGGNDLNGQSFPVFVGTGNKVILFQVSDASHNIASVTAASDNVAYADYMSIDYNAGSFIGGMIINTDDPLPAAVDYQITVQDDGGTANNGIDSYVATVTIVYLDPVSYTAEFSTIDAQYHAQPFTVDQAGTIYIESTESSYTDFEFRLYETSFTASNTSLNLLTNSQTIAYELEKDKQYILVTDNKGNGVGSSINVLGIASGNIKFGLLPYLDFVDNVSLDEDGNVTIDLSGITDGNGNTDNVSLSVSADVESNFESLQITNNQDGTGNLVITPAVDYNGINTLTITVTNATGNTYDRVFEVTIDAVNDAPVLASVGDQSIAEQIELIFTASARDQDLPENTLTFGLDESSISNGMSINAATGEFIWTPSESQGGADYTATITVSDGSLEDSETFTISVSDVLTVNDKIDNTLKIYPNPASNQFSVYAKKQSAVGIYDLNGVLILESNTNTLINVQHLNNGIYLILADNQILRLVINK